MSVKNGSPTSDRIKELIESTKTWLKTEVVAEYSEPQPPSIQEEEIEDEELIAF